MLRRGTLVSGASRFRWAGWDAEIDAVRAVLATFPDPDPSRAFSAERCVRATLRGGRQAIEIPREAAARKGLFKRESFWDVLMQVVSGGSVYAGYSYRELQQLTLQEVADLAVAHGERRHRRLTSRWAFSPVFLNDILYESTPPVSKGVESAFSGAF